MNLFIVPSWYPTKLHPEAGTFFRDQAHILSLRGFDITIISLVQHSLRDLFNYKSAPEIWRRENQLRVLQKETINRYPKLERLAFRSYQTFAVNLLKQGINKRGKPDAVYIQSSLWAGAALGSFLNNHNIPFAVSEHLLNFLQDDGFSAFQKSAIEKSYQYAHSIVATSLALKKSISQQFSKTSSKIRIIPNPANFSVFQIKSTKISSDFQFVSVALFRPEKRLDLLLNAFSKVHKVYNNTHLTLVGDGPLQNQIKKQIQTLKLRSAVTLTGYINKQDVARQLQNSDIFVLSSDVETFGVAPIEAMACGLPVLATNCGGPIDYVTQETGLIVQTNNVQSLAEGMMNLIVNYEKYCPKTIRLFVKNKYGDKMYADLVRSMLTLSV